ncbi:hypothetical protein SDJN03_13746, partial [Cucurbita argyrosperma subsp. sororia]
MCLLSKMGVHGKHVTEKSNVGDNRITNGRGSTAIHLQLALLRKIKIVATQSTIRLGSETMMITGVLLPDPTQSKKLEEKNIPCGDPAHMQHHQVSWLRDLSTV